jgi:transposase
LLDANLWRRILGVDRATVIESVEQDEEADALVVRVCPRRPTKRRCGRCGVRSPGYDRGEGRRRWRCLDLGSVLRTVHPRRTGVDVSAELATVQVPPGPLLGVVVGGRFVVALRAGPTGPR